MKMTLQKYPKPLELDVTMVQSAPCQWVYLRVCDKFGACAQVRLSALHQEYMAKKAMA